MKVKVKVKVKDIILSIAAPLIILFIIYTIGTFVLF